MPTVQPYEERLARWERMAAKHRGGKTMEVIGAEENPPLTKERVRQILSKPPRPVGRPRNPE